VTEDAKVLVYPLAEAGAGAGEGTGDGAGVLPVRGERWPLRRSGAGFTVTDPWSGVTRHFAAPAGGPGAVAGAAAEVETYPLVAITDRVGHRVDIDRDAVGCPVLVRHSGGYRVAVEVNEARDRVVGYRLLERAVPETPAESRSELEPVVGVGAESATGAGPQTAAEPGSGAVVLGFGYGWAGDLCEVTDSDGAAQRFDYDEEHRVVRWVDRNGTWFSYRYDDQSRCVASAGPDGVFSAVFSYLPVRIPSGDADGWVTTFTDALGAVTRYRVNEAYQIVSATDPVGAVTASVWDEADRLVERTDPLGRTSRFTYDEVGDLVAVAGPDGLEVTADYDGAHQPVRVVDVEGAVTRFAYDGVGRLVERVDPDGAATRVVPEVAEGLTAPGVVSTTRVDDAAGGSTWVGLDAAGLPVAVVDPAGAWTQPTPTPTSPTPPTNPTPSDSHPATYGCVTTPPAAWPTRFWRMVFLKRVTKTRYLW
jgi:YD repeat-containing protein